MPSSYKKSKSAWQAEKDATQQQLRQWRADNYRLAEARDGGLCVVCWFLHEHTRTQASAHHHLYGRDQVAGGWREHYTNILCVCEEHHPPPIITPFASKALGWVEEVARLANEQPISRKFKHVYTGPVINGKTDS